MSLYSTLLVQVARDQLPLLSRLAQYYAHDMFEHWPDPKQIRIRESGAYEPWFDVEAYVDAPGREAFLVRAQDQPAGFVLTERLIDEDGRALWRLAEFFVVRHLRRSGVGRAAAFKLFELKPGAWKIAVLRRNLGAAKFWRSVIRRGALASEVREIDARTPEWDGPVFTFAVGDQAARGGPPPQDLPGGRLTLGEMIASELDVTLLRA